ncbi:multidrug efflux pump subunit AcrB [Anaerobacterium chartisolvens]|uniref:Multidrug efflux pump subunit AcrB n=1 Tax=Anaerobacterium chartisolvens TaxID=1297424 RepID=A0A369B6Q2_9FIRM|nr:efflux RND transporter permease subunit [Anaerobacterium chartisolvens]RCX17189.1 multidrug efflux pump subunit AcrB [Anaerobacterium chartisolvens]
MKNDIIHAAIKNRTVTIFMIILVAIAGIYSFYISPRQENPDVSAPAAKITTIYPGASPKEVERLVTSKIEDELTGIEGYDFSKSFSRNGISVVIINLTDDADIDKAWDELRRKMNDIQRDLPEQCEKIDVNTNMIETAGMIISLSGEKYSYEQLASYAENLKKDLTKVDGITRFDVVGKQEMEIKVEVDIDKLNQYALSLDDVLNILKAQNIEIPSGKIEDGSSKINVKTSGMYESLEDIKNTIVEVSGQNGSVVRLGDIADVYTDLEDSNYKIRQDGENAVLLAGYFNNNENIVFIGKEVRAIFDKAKSGLPSDIKIDEVIFQPGDVEKAVKSFVLNLLEGVLFVVIIVFLGMGWRNAVAVSTAIPVSILVTLAAMGVMKIEIHQISITALIVALGMLVDNAIVVSDAIQVRIDEGEDKLEACLRGTKETAVPILTSTLTTIAVFVPLLLLPGAAGEFLKSIPQICIAALSASFLVALFVTPTMAYMLFKKGKSLEKKSIIRSFFSNLLSLAMKKKAMTLIAALLIFFVSLRIIPVLGLQFFPKADKSILYINFKSENASNIDKTEKSVIEMEKILSAQPEVLSYTSAIGDGLPKFFFSIEPGSQSADVAQTMLQVDLKREKRFKTNEELANYLQGLFDSEIVGGNATVKLLENGKPIGDPVQIRVVGDDMEAILENARNIKDELNTIEGTVNVNDDSSDKEYEFFIDIDDDTATSMGFTKADIQKQISIALKGMKASVFRKSGNETNIILTSDIKSKDQLENLAIKSSFTGNKVLLKQVANISLMPQTPQLKKYDRELAISVSSGVKPGYSSVTIQNQLQKRLESMELDNVRVVFNGEREEIISNFGDLGVFSAFAMLIIFMILMIQFGSLVQPLIVMLTIPLSVIGSILGLLVFGNPLSFTAVFGIVSLIGIVVNNAIILIDYINGERVKGAVLDDACKAAAAKRLRPVMLTTITTVIGLIPLAFSGSSMFAPMSITLMSGLIVATLLTLVVIPVFFSLTMRRIKKI